MILSYSKENVILHNFPKKIISRIKIHTIRADYSNRWKVGNKIHQVTGLRTKYYDCFTQDVCKGIQPIHFYFDRGILRDVSIDGKPYTDICGLAHNDGFDNTNDFVDYFSDVAIQSKKEFLNMKIIHFTNFKY